MEAPAPDPAGRGRYLLATVPSGAPVVAGKTRQRQVSSARGAGWNDPELPPPSGLPIKLATPPLLCPALCIMQDRGKT